jgi:hypothetical protein
MKRLVFFITLTAVLQFSASAQRGFFKSKDAYLGQKRPLDTPLVFANSMLVPDSGIAMDRSTFSADGKEYYYCNAQSWFNSGKTRVRYFKFDGKKWQGPFTLVQGYYAPTFSTDGQTLYLSGGKGDGKHRFLYAVHRQGDGWTQPEVYWKLNFGFYDYMPTNSGTGYVGSNARQGDKFNFKTYDFCSFHINGADTVIQSLGPEINTPGFDGDFYIAPDESYMVVSYKEKPDYECELGISFRRADGSWPAPVNLGPLINDGDAHRWGEYVTPDGKYLFYTKGHNDKDCHLYWVRFDTLKKRLLQQAKARKGVKLSPKS